MICRGCNRDIKGLRRAMCETCREWLPDWRGRLMVVLAMVLVIVGAKGLMWRGEMMMRVKMVGLVVLVGFALAANSQETTDKIGMEQGQWYMSGDGVQCKVDSSELPTIKQHYFDCVLGHDATLDSVVNLMNYRLQWERAEHVRQLAKIKEEYARKFAHIKRQVVAADRADKQNRAQAVKIIEKIQSDLIKAGAK